MMTGPNIYLGEGKPNVSDRPLRRDIRYLGDGLGMAIKQHFGQETFERIEAIRRFSKGRRRGQESAGEELKALIAGLTVAEMERVIRALSVFFDLANLAEEQHRIRVLRIRARQMDPLPQRNSVGEAVGELKRRGLTAVDTQSLYECLLIELVITAHPTEAKRRTVRHVLRRLRQDLGALERPDLTPEEDSYFRSRMQGDIASLLSTEPTRLRRPTVMEEVLRGLYVIDELWDVIPQLCYRIRESLKSHYPDAEFDVPPPIRFRSWIGGDRDGNPFVTPQVTIQTLSLMRRHAIEHHINACDELKSVLTLSDSGSPATAELRASIARSRHRWSNLNSRIEQTHHHELYRHWLAMIRYRLEATLATRLDAHPNDACYADSEELAEDVKLISRTLCKANYQFLATVRVRRWIDQISAFGFHMARLDIREDSHTLHTAIDELARAGGAEECYMQLDEKEKRAFLTGRIDGDFVERIKNMALAGDARKALSWVRFVQRVAAIHGRAPLGALIVSMTHDAADLLTLGWLNRLAAALNDQLCVPLPFVPLFETIDDLRHGSCVLEQLLTCVPYRKHIESLENQQVCMVGYSDSTKDGGYLAANWYLYQAQRSLANTARQHGVELVLFHGRGGALGRGGGPAARGILSLPTESVNGKLHITEQGEVLAERYDHPDIALRHLEQVLWATLLVSTEKQHDIDESDEQIIEIAAEAGFRAYRDLIEAKGFMEFFGGATPIDIIESLNIGSRPSRRGNRQNLADLRAIPYTFAWTQNRLMLTAFYGMGAGFESLLETKGDQLQRMYQRWPAFRAIVQNAELALAKCDFAIGAEYKRLVENHDESNAIWERLIGEQEKAKRAVLHISGHDHLLSRVPWLKKSIQLRNPYIDPLNLIQIELLQRLRLQSATESADSESTQSLARCLRLTINGVAAGMRTTG